MYRRCHGAVIVTVIILCCCSKNLCEQPTFIQRLFQVDRLPQWSKNSEPFTASDTQNGSKESLPSKGHLIDLNRRHASLSGADRDLVAERKYDRLELTLSYLTDRQKREKSRMIDAKSFLEKKLAFIVVKFLESVLKNSVAEVHGVGNVSCRWYLDFKNYTNLSELMFRTANVSKNVKFGIRRASVKPYLKLTRQSVIVNITRSLREIPPNVEQDTSAFRPISRRNAIIKRRSRSPFRQKSVTLLQTPKSLPIGHVETTWLNSNTTIVPNDVTNRSSEIDDDDDDDEIVGMPRENFLVLISSFAIVGLGAAGIAAFFIRRHRQRNDPEYRRLLSVKIVTGIYYNQTGVCF